MTDVTIQPGHEADIATALNGGSNVHLVAGQVYALADMIHVTGDDVTLDGHGATITLSTSFNNRKYAPLALHGDLHDTAPSPLPTAFGIYLNNVCDVTLKNFKIIRQHIDGSVVRSIAVVKSSDVRLQNVEATGNTIGYVIEFVDSDGWTVEDCYIHDIAALNQSGTLDLTGAGTPNLTGICVDDVDLLDATQRQTASLHCSDFAIINSYIARLSMSSTVAIRQTDGINIQRGYHYRVLNNVIVDTDEGVDTFGSQGLVAHNIIKLTAGYGLTASAGVKLIHGATNNLVLHNTIINRNIATIVDYSPFPSLTTADGVSRNVIALNKASGSGSKLFRVSTNPSGINPNKNSIIGNMGGSVSSDYALSDPNFYGPAIVKVADFNGDARPDVLFLYSSGLSMVYLCGAAGHPLEVTPTYGQINNVSNPDDVIVHDLNGDGKSDILVRLGSDTHRTYLSDLGNTPPFVYKGTITY